LRRYPLVLSPGSPRWRSTSAELRVALMERLLTWIRRIVADEFQQRAVGIAKVKTYATTLDTKAWNGTEFHTDAMLG
jgi:hypothetical protein